jgi:asparagine synthetase B (glutamine-hydrolysing)
MAWNHAGPFSGSGLCAEMCGMCGRLHFCSVHSMEREGAKHMNAALAHRGPDDAGIYSRAAALAQQGLLIEEHCGGS